MYFRHYLRYNICIKTKNRKKGQKTPRRIVVQLKNGVFFIGTNLPQNVLRLGILV